MSVAARADEGDDAEMSAYKEFTGKTVEEALRLAREEFGAGLDDLDFEILTPGSRGVLGMGAEPARIVAAPRAALGGAAPKREAAAATPLPAARPRLRRDRRTATTGRPAATTVARAATTDRLGPRTGRHGRPSHATVDAPVEAPRRSDGPAA